MIKTKRNRYDAILNILKEHGPMTAYKVFMVGKIRNIYNTHPPYYNILKKLEKMDLIERVVIEGKYLNNVVKWKIK